MLPRALRVAAMHSAGGLLKVAGRAERLRQAEKLFRLSALEDDEQILHLMTYLDEAGKQALYSPAWRTEVNGYSSYELIQRQMRNVPLEGEPLSRLMARDIETNMVDDALVKVDRASMACSLEVRCPLLDHYVLELAMRIPPEYKIAGGRRKIVLNEALKDVLPRSIVERRKQGFEVPFASWFQRDPWRSLLVDTLAEERIRRQGIFDPAGVTALRDAFLNDPEARHQRVSAYQLRHHVWMLFVFQVWHERFMESRTAEAWG
jgi:asparagine synthase (glutamine-hydrolysing)